MSSKSKKWFQKLPQYAFDFITVFTGITVAFLLNSWSENRKDVHTETKILMEIKNGLQLDTVDIRENIMGHKLGLAACQYFRALVNDQPVSEAQIGQQFVHLLRDFISIQNKSGYESLKSKGLELISDDSLRLSIIAMYDFNFQVLEKLEEGYAENQFYTNYFHRINDILAPHMSYNEQGHLIGLQQPLKLTPVQKNQLLSYLLKIEYNRKYIIGYYLQVNQAAVDLMGVIDQELAER